MRNIPISSWTKVKSSSWNQSSSLRTLRLSVALALPLILAACAWWKQPSPELYQEPVKSSPKSWDAPWQSSVIKKEPVKSVIQPTQLKPTNTVIIYSSVPWKNDLLNNIVKQKTLEKETILRVSDVVKLGNWLYEITADGNVRCYVLESGKMFMDVYNMRLFDGMRNGSTQRMAWFKEMVIFIKDMSRTEIHEWLFNKNVDKYGNISYTRWLPIERVRFVLKQENNWQEITQDDKMTNFNARYLIWRTHMTGQMVKQMQIKKWNRGYRLEDRDIQFYTQFYKVMRPKHLKELLDFNRIDKEVYDKYIQLYKWVDSLFIEMAWDEYYIYQANQYWDQITKSEIDAEVKEWRLDKKTWEKLKKKFK